MTKACRMRFSSLTTSLIHFGKMKGLNVPYSKVWAQINALVICSATAG